MKVGGPVYKSRVERKETNLEKEQKEFVNLCSRI